MGEKIFRKNFSGSKGVENSESPLVVDPLKAITFLNGRITRRGTLAGRRGTKATAQTDDFAVNSGNYFFPYNGIHTYSYADKSSGQPVEQLVAGCLNSFFVLREGSGVNLTSVNGNPFTYSVLLDETSSTFRFVLTENGSPVTIGANPYFDMGTGLENSPTIRLYDLVVALDGLANYTCSGLMGARVNGNQVGVTTITVDAGHGISAGDLVYFTNGLTAFYTVRLVTAVTATTFSITGAAVNVNNGYMVNDYNLWATAVEETDSVPTSTTTLKIYYKWWVPMPPFVTTSLEVFPTGKYSRNVSYANLNDVCYCVHPNVNSGALYKYDGNRLYQAGMPTELDLVSVVVGGAGNVDVGDHRWMVVLWQIDNQGNYIESNAMEALTATTAPSSVTVTWNTTQSLANVAYDASRAIVNGNQVGVTTIAVSANTLIPQSSYIPGDMAYFLDRSTSTYVTRRVTGVTATTITIAGAAVNVNNADLISNNFGAIIYRTKANGLEFFQVAKVPGAATTTQAYVDNIADVNLGAQYIEPLEVHDAPPRFNYITEHQSKLVGSLSPIKVSDDDIGEPNTIAWSTDESPEYFPPTNAEDLPPTVVGGITGLKTDNENILIVGKEKGLYGLFGDLASGSFTTNTISEGDYGFLSHDSIVRIGQRLVFPTTLGFATVFGGELDPGFGSQTFGFFFNNNGTPETGYYSSSNPDSFYLPEVVGINSPEDGVAVWCFPSGPGNTWAGEKTLHLAYDYQRGAWYDWKFGYDDSTGDVDVVNAANMLGGAAIYKNRLWCLARRKRMIGGVNTPNGALFRFHYYRFTNPKYNYADNHLKIPYDFQPNWDTGAEPSIDKELKAFKAYMLDPGNFVPFVLRVRTYRNFATTSPDSDLFLTFASVSDLWKIGTLKLNKCQDGLFRLTVSALHSSPTISGYEYTVSGHGIKDGFSRQ